MDLEQRVPRAVGSIPRLSKSPLPLPLAANDNLRATRTATRREPSRGSNLPRPSTGYGGGAGGNTLSPAVFGDHVDLSSARHRYDWNSHTRTVRSVKSVKSRLNIRDTLQPVADNSLDTTPPGSNANGPLFEEGDENHDVQHAVGEKKARPQYYKPSSQVTDDANKVASWPITYSQYRHNLNKHLQSSATSAQGPRQNPVPSSQSSRSKKAEAASTTKLPRVPSQEPSHERGDKLKSSAALRSAIAKAKAARKDAAAKPTTSPGVFDILTTEGSSVGEQVDVMESNRGLLRSRVRSALTSGNLNISAMKLGHIPAEVISMYEPDETSVNWAEVVDLVKFNAADNELTHLEDHVFPDLSLEEASESEDKANQFGGIESLDLHNNQLNSLLLGLRRLERLTWVNLSGNRLTNECLCIVWQLPNIQDLNLARNRLTGNIELPSSSVSKLLRLNLSGNSIDALILDPDTPSPLTSLDVSNNQLADLPWEILASFDLVQLNASANRLVTVVVSPLLRDAFTSLKEIDLSRNSIEAIEPELRLPSVQSFAVNSNRLDSLPDISSWQNLVTLQAAENNLSEIPPGLMALTSVKSVDLSLNNIKTLDPRISKLKTLTSLQLTGNPLRDRNFLSLDTEDDIDLSVINLESPIHTLRLSNNDITVFPTALLRHPSVNGSLKSLDLSHNPLAATAYLGNGNDNDNESNNVLHLPALESLYLVSTGLDSLVPLLTQLKAPHLRELNISCHRLTGPLPEVRTAFPTCTTLLATDNWFSAVGVNAVRGLEVLDIRNNEIDSLPPALGLLGNHPGARGGKLEPGRLRSFECGGNRFRVPRITVIEKGTEAVLKDLRRMIPETDVPDDWRNEI
ncbi:hypothetical protein DV735_g5256, partial [Chaetothyriales sp. CBS 134920]